MDHGCIDCKWLQYTRSINYCMMTNKIIDKDKLGDLNCTDWATNWKECKRSKKDTREKGIADYEQMSILPV